MRTILVEASLSIGFAARREETLEVEVEDNATQEEIDQAADDAVRDWAYNYIDFGYNIRA